MRTNLSINLDEVRNMNLSLNAYLALITLKHGGVLYIIRQADLIELKAKEWLTEIGDALVNSKLSEKAEKYFGDDLFAEFYKAFPHLVLNEFFDYRPLRNKEIDTLGAKTTRRRWNRITKGNKELQREIINILKEEVKWRESTGKLRFMHNIDTWLNQSDWEKYKYLLNDSPDTNMVTDL